MTRTGEPGTPRAGGVLAQAGVRKGAPAAQPGHLPALSDLYHAQYWSLFRLALLLTGDADTAEPWCWTPLPRCTRPRKHRSGEQRATALAATAGGRSGPTGHHHLRDGSKRSSAVAGLPAAPDTAGPG